MKLLLVLLPFTIGKDKRGNENDDYYTVVDGFGEGGVHQMNQAGDADAGHEII